jgi:hypothetical protein
MSGQERDAPEASTEDLGAAQFVTKLNDDQLQHLQFSIPNKHDAERLSRFLEQPRRVPVPTRFTFAPRDASAPGKHSRTESSKSTSNAKHSRTESNKSTKSASKHSRADSTWSIRTFGIGKHSRSNSEKSTSSRYGSEGSTVSRISGDLLREVEKVASVDWRFYTTGACLCVVNLVAAWDTTTLPIALPVSTPTPRCTLLF